MSPSRSLTSRSPASLETSRDILGNLVAHYRRDEVLTAVRQIPARGAESRPVPAWAASPLSEAHRAKEAKHSTHIRPIQPTWYTTGKTSS
jgi:hypothetical protein